MATRLALFWAAWLLFLATLSDASTPAGLHYLGAETCRLCHRAIAETQSRTAMANTWQTGHTDWVAPDFIARFAEGPQPVIMSEVRRLADFFQFSVTLPGHAANAVPVEAMVGGKRHGIGFLARVQEVDGVTLARPVLVQARYAWSVREQKLVLAPGCPEAKPLNYKTAFGLSLSPEYERRCLECHGQPHTLGADARGGVQCEACHGPGENHLQALAKQGSNTGMVNPAHQDADASIAVCARCHVGLTRFSDPAPEDLLVANQVVALKSSECFLQSSKGLTCTTCHDPHDDAPDVEAVSQRACLGCHSLLAKPHAAVCPVNASAGCIGCHMPSLDVGPFHLVDHLIRVHPEQHVVVPPAAAAIASQFPRISEFLEQTTSSAAAVGIQNTGSQKQYLGRQTLAELPPALAQAAARLTYGESTRVPVANQTVVLRRMPRDFKIDATRLVDSAEIRLTRGDLAGAIAQSEAALASYPASLRALIIIGRALGLLGDFPGAAAVLQKAVAWYPDDANAAFNLARILGRQGRAAEAILTYRRAIASDPDLVPAYLNLGNALRTTGENQEAAQVLRAGLQIDPLSSDLYRALHAVLLAQGDTAGAARLTAVAESLEGSSTR